MSFSYHRLWHLLLDRNMTKEQLRVAVNVSPSTIAKMGRGENVSLDVLERICKHLNCKLEDVIEYVDNGN